MWGAAAVANCIDIAAMSSASVQCSAYDIIEDPKKGVCCLGRRNNKSVILIQTAQQKQQLKQGQGHGDLMRSISQEIFIQTEQSAMVALACACSIYTLTRGTVALVHT
eukprot:1161343-Pelagomonas_calceolata.AAC.6